MHIEFTLIRLHNARAERAISILIDKWATCHNIAYKIEGTDSGARLYLEEECDYALFAMTEPTRLRWAIVP